MNAGSPKSIRIAVDDSSQIGEARRAAAALADEAALGDELTGRVALIVSEAATNIVRHGQPLRGADGGAVVLRLLADGTRTGVEMLALDHGRGIADLPAAMRDGFSTVGTRGGGLGAIARLSSRFDMVSAPAAGTVILSQIWTSTPKRRDGLVEIGAVCLPLHGEASNGDAWFASIADGGLTEVVIADGLGHGHDAAEASDFALRAFTHRGATSLADALARVHASLRATRGAAISAAFVDAANDRIEFGGIGNVAGTIVMDQGTRSMVSHNGTAGVSARKIGTFQYSWPANAIAVMHSDGLTSHWTLDRFPGLARRHPSLIAGVLYRDCARARDDVTVVVCRRRGELPI